MSIDAKMKELRSVIGRLERQDMPLEEAMVLFERGRTLGGEISTLIDEAAAKMTIDVIDQNGQPTELGKEQR